MIRVELVKLFRRPRTWLTIALLDALPTLVAILLAITHLGPRPGQGPAFLSAVLTNGSLFALIAIGYTMVYGIIELVNFAHGDLVMLGSFLALSLVGSLGLESSHNAG